MSARTPCKGCMSRYVGCHADCEKYLAYRERIDAEKKAKARERELNVFQIQKKYRTDRVRHSFEK